MNWGQIIAGLALLALAWLTTKAWIAQAEARNHELEAELADIDRRRRCLEIRPEARR